MTKQEIESVFTETGVMKEGHFKLKSGKHSPVYFNAKAIQQYPMKLNKFIDAWLEMLKEKVDINKIDRVVGPAEGGIALAYSLAEKIGKDRNRECLMAYTSKDKETGMMQLRKNFDLPSNENIVVVEDVITTGGSVQQTIDSLSEKNANIIAVCLMVDRTGGAVKFEGENIALYTTEAITYESDNCPLCNQNLPLTAMSNNAKK
ncbi:MAG: hypothetical protein A2Y22_04990 [Clostridiales bacterium GWD2_32_59]|nr:MAG: hypothetical protein A2Y22_04990 [Clostridiales bacterium GWD2_32_59]